METNKELPTQVLRPILDTYLDASVAITGCQSYGIARTCCEYDVLVVNNERTPHLSVKAHSSYMDLYFMSEKEVLSPSDPEVAVSLAMVKPVRDNSLVFSTSSSAARAVLRMNQKRSAESRLATSLKALGRTDEAISKAATPDADFWLLAAGYEFALAWLYLMESTPAPSHLLDQLKENSKESPDNYEAFSLAAGLGKASRKGCADRIDGLSVIYDAINTLQSREPEDAGSVSTRTAFDILKAKADFLRDGIRHVDCYVYLGLELCRVLPVLSQIQSRTEAIEIEQSLLVGTLLKGDQKLLGERVIQGLGLSRDDKAIRAGAESLREAVSNLAKRI
jgi:hypothetical protein